MSSCNKKTVFHFVKDIENFRFSTVFSSAENIAFFENKRQIHKTDYLCSAYLLFLYLLHLSIYKKTAFDNIFVFNFAENKYVDYRRGSAVADAFSKAC